MAHDEELKLEEKSGWEPAQKLLRNGLLSVIMPAHNLGKDIAENVRIVHRVLSGNIPFEIVVVDDGSTDNTSQEIDSVAKDLPNIVAVKIKENSGKGAALSKGFESCKGTHILLLDADLDLPPDQISNFFEIMSRTGAAVVIGSKRHPDSKLNYPWHRRLASNVYYAIVKIAFGLPIRDTQTGIKLFRREVLDFVIPRMLVKRFAFDLELLVIAHIGGFSIAEAPVTLKFGSKFGCIRPSAVRQVMLDTLAIFYRARVLNYYQTLRPIPLPEKPPSVSVVIAFPAPTAYIEECISALKEQKPQPDEIILLPDYPTGRTWGYNIKEIPTGPIRPAEKRNIGINEAKGDIIAFLDDDAAPLDGWLKKAICRFGDPNTAAVGGPATTPANDCWLAKLGGEVYANILVSGNYRYRYIPEIVREVDDFPSCNLLVRRDVLKKLGGFRTDFWPGEDTILCMQIVHELGMKIVYDPWVQAYHHRRKLFLPHLRQVGRYALHRGYFSRKFPATSRKISYMLPTLFTAGLVLGAAASVVFPIIKPLYIAAVLTYLILVFLFAFPWEKALCLHRINPLSWLIVAVGIILTHLVYGIRFAEGLFIKKLPGEVRPFDHPSEKK